MVFWPCDFEGNRDDAKFVHARELVGYLEGRFGFEDLMEMVAVQGDSVQRRWFRWRAETADNLICAYSVDAFLCEVFAGEVMLLDLPAQCFSFRRIKRKGIKGRKIPKATRHAAGQRILKGESPKIVAAEFGRSVDCVRRWAQACRNDQKVAA